MNLSLNYYIRDLFKLSIYLLAFSIPSNNVILKSIIILSCVFFSLFNIKKFKLSSFNILIIVLFCFTLLGVSYTSPDNKTIAWFSVEKSLSLIAFPFIFSTNRIFFNQSFLRKTLIIFVISILLMGIFNCINLLTAKSIYTHRIYISVNLLIAQSIIFTYLYKSPALKLKLKFLLEFTLLICLGLILVSTSKLGLILSSILTIYYFATSLKIDLYSLSKLILLTTLIILVALNSEILLSRLINFIDKGDSTRTRIWISAIEVIKNNFWMGVGTGDVVSSLNEYRNTGWFKEFGTYNCHNQFLEIFVKHGIFGFMTLLLIVILLIKKTISNRSVLILLYTIIIISVFMIESYLSVQHGIIPFCFLSNIILLRSYENN